MTPLTMMTMLSNTWASGIASARRVDEVLDTVPEVQDAPDAVALPETAPGRVVFENVSFHYNGNSDEAVLEGYQPGRRTGTDRRHPGRHRRRQIDPDQPGARVSTTSPPGAS